MSVACILESPPRGRFRDILTSASGRSVEPVAAMAVRVWNLLNSTGLLKMVLNSAHHWLSCSCIIWPPGNGLLTWSAADGWRDGWSAHCTLVCWQCPLLLSSPLLLLTQITLVHSKETFFFRADSTSQKTGSASTATSSDGKLW